MSIGITRLVNENEQLRAENAELRKVIKSVEWKGPHEALAICPECFEPEHNGHSPDCALKKALGEG